VNKTNNQPLIFEISQTNFQDLVIHNSSTVPVIVEFMAIWSGPCIQMADELAQLATEFAGDFIFAKIDIDEQEALKTQFSIENVPSILVFKNGVEVQREQGQYQSDELRLLLKHYGVFRPSDELREQARELHLTGSTSEAIMLLTKAISADSSNVRVALDMVQIFLDINELKQAEGLFNKLGDQAQNSEIGLAIASQLNFKKLAQATRGLEVLQNLLAQEPDNSQVQFDLAICWVAQHNIERAMDLLFQIQQNDAQFRAGAAREMIGMLCNMMEKTNPEKSKNYRQRLANSLST
jgi:putative thioredoxin